MLQICIQIRGRIFKIYIFKYVVQVVVDYRYIYISTEKAYKCSRLLVVLFCIFNFLHYYSAFLAGTIPVRNTKLSSFCWCFTTRTFEVEIMLILWIPLNLGIVYHTALIIPKKGYDDRSTGNCLLSYIFQSSWKCKWFVLVFLSDPDPRIRLATIRMLGHFCGHGKHMSSNT